MGEEEEDWKDEKSGKEMGIEEVHRSEERQEEEGRGREDGNRRGD